MRADEKKKSSEGKAKKGGASIDEGSHAGPEQGPLGLPDVVAQAHEDGSLYPLARSGATAVATDDNVMFLFGGFVLRQLLALHSIPIDSVSFTLLMYNFSAVGTLLIFWTEAGCGRRVPRAFCGLLRLAPLAQLGHQLLLAARRPLGCEGREGEIIKGADSASAVTQGGSSWRGVELEVVRAS